MIIKWRDTDYELNIKNIIAHHDKQSTGNINKNIYAFDTESVLLPDGRYEIQCFQIASPNNTYDLQYVPTRANSLELFINYFVENFPEEYDGGKCFLYAHNLVYDWLQLIKNYPDLVAMARTGIGLNVNYEIYQTNEYNVILLRNGLFEGNAPFFDIKIENFETEESYIIMFRDTFSFFPSSLKKLGKELKLAQEKEERQSDLGIRDYRLESMSPDKRDFEQYAKIDAQVTRQVAEKIRELHINAGMKKIRVSAPSYAIGYLLHELPEETVLKNGVNNKKIMQLILDTYAGGRTGGIYHGKVEKISVLDFHSSYPASMVSLPSFTESMTYLQIPNAENLSMNEFINLCEDVHLFARISGEETDPHYPALIHRVKGMLTPIYGKFENKASTGIEILVGIKSGTLHISKIHEVVLLDDEDPEILPFKDFAQNAYNRKANSEKGSAEYTSAKLVLNSSYGKLIEARSDTLIDNAVRDVIIPYTEEKKLEFAQAYYTQYIEMLKENKTDFISYIDELITGVYENFPHEEILTAPFENLSLTKLTYGRFAIPAAASLITATSRARLCAVMKATNAIYWDTDSVFIKDYDKETVNEKLKLATEWLPNFILPLIVGENLGDLDLELENANGYLAGTKRYYLTDGKHIKKALHGMPTVPFDEAESMIEKLATGKDNPYTGRAKPLSAKEAKTGDDIGKFTKKDYLSVFRLDDRLEWENKNNSWFGTVKRNS